MHSPVIGITGSGILFTACRLARADQPTGCIRPQCHRYDAHMVTAGKIPSLLLRVGVLGFSLIEMMVVLAVLGALAAVAAPGFQDLFESYRVNAARDNLISTIQFARTEAIRTGQAIVIRRNGGCPNDNWGCGWIVFRDTNGNNTQQAGEPSIRSSEIQRGVSIRANNVAASNFVQVNSFGQFSGSLFFSFLIGPTSNTTSQHCTAMAFSAGMRATSDKGSGNCPGP